MLRGRKGRVYPVEPCVVETGQGARPEAPTNAVSKGGDEEV